MEILSKNLINNLFNTAPKICDNTVYDQLSLSACGSSLLVLAYPSPPPMPAGALSLPEPPP
jgi:hypothetical protein